MWALEGMPESLVWRLLCPPPALDRFPILQPMEEDGFVIEMENDERRFKEGRNGNNLIYPFQCDLCQFHNLKGQDPGAMLADESLLLCIRRAILD